MEKTARWDASLFGPNRTGSKGTPSKVVPSDDQGLITGAAVGFRFLEKGFTD